MSTARDTREIEIRFLVASTAWPRAARPVSILQGYLSIDPDRVVRVRVAGAAASLTVKGRSSGGIRAEFEYPVPIEHAMRMLALRIGSVIGKQRHVVTLAGVVWEIDEFTGDNAGLVIAEVEVDELAQLDAVRAQLPEWVGREITDDPRYANSSLATRPFSTW